MKNKEDTIYSMLESNYLQFMPGTRVELTRRIDGLDLEIKSTGTVQYIDILGTIHVVWDKGKIKKGIFYNENSITRIREPDIQSLEKNFQFNTFIDMLRNIFQCNHLIINGRTEDLSFEEIEAVLTLSMDMILSDRNNYFSYIASYSKDNAFLDSDLGIHNIYKKKDIPFDFIADDLFKKDALSEKIKIIITQNKKEIENNLRRRAITQ